MVGLDLERECEPLYGDGEEVVFGTAWVWKEGEGRFSVVTYGAGPRGTDDAFLYPKVDVERVQELLASSPPWPASGSEARKLTGGATADIQYARRVLRAGAVVRDAVAEAGGVDVVCWLQRHPEDGLRAHLLLADPESARDRAAAAAVAATFGAQLVECGGCDSETPVLVRGGALERLGLGALEEPVERRLRSLSIPPF
jgi:hypothetical protein